MTPELRERVEERISLQGFVTAKQIVEKFEAELTAAGYAVVDNALHQKMLEAVEHIPGGLYEQIDEAKAMLKAAEDQT